MFSKISFGLALLVGLAVSALVAPGAQAQVTYSWGTPGAHPWTAPNIQDMMVTFDLLGAQGGASSGANSALGGRGAEVLALVDVAPATSFVIVVGGQGGRGGTGGFNGGGGLATPGTRAMIAGGGGGASDVRLSGPSLLSRVLVAGGGGGAGVGGAGVEGGAGGASGNVGASLGAAGGGAPGTSRSGGTGGQTGGGTGALGLGGAGASLQPGGAVGGGGGGGYYGGGGGGSGGTGGAGGGGGGGSSNFRSGPIDPDNVMVKDGVRAGDGYVSATVSGQSDAVCLGRPATMIAMAGGVTRGTPGNDVIVASGAPDRIASGAGSDLVCSRGGADLVKTGPGDDRVSAGAGRDRVSTGPGNDRVDVAGGKTDRVNCGRGRDRAHHDRADLLSRCETRRPAGRRRSHAAAGQWRP